MTICTYDFSLAVLSAYNVCLAYGPWFPSLDTFPDGSVLKGTSKYYLRSWHEHVTAHYALNVQLELSSHFSQMICVLVTKHPDTFIFGDLLFVCLFLFPRLSFIQAPSPAYTSFSVTLTSVFPFIHCFYYCMGARHRRINVTVSKMCSLFPSSKYSNLSSTQP